MNYLIHISKTWQPRGNQIQPKLGYMFKHSRYWRCCVLHIVALIENGINQSDSCFLVIYNKHARTGGNITISFFFLKGQPSMSQGPVHGQYSTSVLQTCAASAGDWFIKGRAMCYQVFVITHVNIHSYLPYEQGIISQIIGFCLSVYILHVQNNGLHVIQ